MVYEVAAGTEAVRAGTHVYPVVQQELHDVIKPEGASEVEEGHVEDIVFIFKLGNHVCPPVPILSTLLVVFKITGVAQDVGIRIYPAPGVQPTTPFYQCISAIPVELPSAIIQAADAEYSITTQESRVDQDGAMGTVLGKETRRLVAGVSQRCVEDMEFVIFDAIQKN